MDTIHLQTLIGTDGRIRVDVPVNLPPGPANVTVVVTPTVKTGKSWRDIVGVGKEIWQGEDAQCYIDRLRAEWDS